MRSILVVSLLLGGCSKDSSPPVPPPAQKPAPPTEPAKAEEALGPGSKLLIVDDGKLMRMDSNGRKQLVAKVGDVDNCDVDPLHKVVWLLGGGTMRAYDRTSGKLVTVASGVPKSINAWGVMYGSPPDPYPSKAAGNVDGLSHCAALILTASTKPTIGGEYTGEGDREVYCGEGDEGTDKRTLNDEVVQELASYNKAKLTNGAYVAQLAGRRGGAKAPKLAKPAPKKPVLKIDSSKCEINPEDCGNAEYIGGGRMWKVTTDNSRGDFFHESYQLYDSQDGVFWDPEAGKKQKEPFEDGSQMFDVIIAPDGSWAVWGEMRLSFDDAKVIGEMTTGYCGWE